MADQLGYENIIRLRKDQPEYKEQLECCVRLMAERLPGIRSEQVRVAIRDFSTFLVLVRIDEMRHLCEMVPNEKGELAPLGYGNLGLLGMLTFRDYPDADFREIKYLCVSSNATNIKIASLLMRFTKEDCLQRFKDEYTINDGLIERIVEPVDNLPCPVRYGLPPAKKASYGKDRSMSGESEGPTQRARLMSTDEDTSNQPLFYINLFGGLDAQAFFEKHGFTETHSDQNLSSVLSRVESFHCSARMTCDLLLDSSRSAVRKDHPVFEEAETLISYEFRVGERVLVQVGMVRNRRHENLQMGWILDRKPGKVYVKFDGGGPGEWIPSVSNRLRMVPASVLAKESKMNRSGKAKQPTSGGTLKRKESDVSTNPGDDSVSAMSSECKKAKVLPGPTEDAALPSKKRGRAPRGSATRTRASRKGGAGTAKDTEEKKTTRRAAPRRKAVPASAGAQREQVQEVPKATARGGTAKPATKRACSVMSTSESVAKRSRDSAASTGLGSALSSGYPTQHVTSPSDAVASSSSSIKLRIIEGMLKDPKLIVRDTAALAGLWSSCTGLQAYMSRDGILPLTQHQALAPS